MRSKRATKKIKAPKPVSLPSFPSQETIDALIITFLSRYPAIRQDEIAKLIEERTRFWRRENEIASFND
jgi:hypothetical protein